MPPAVGAAAGRALGEPIVIARPLAGGDTNQAYRIQLRSGRVAFLKTRPDAPPRFFASEAKGLAWLREARAVRIPEVLAASPGEVAGPDFLILEWIPSAPRRKDFDEVLGQRLAALHRDSAGVHGLSFDNYIGPLAQVNESLPRWADFYRERRLEPQLRLALARGLLGEATERRFARLFSQLDQLVGPTEPPARLHGDLWVGNLHVDEHGCPCLIDPAVYGGHREMDLGMMRLFGGFSPRVFAAYAEAYPLATGHSDRVSLCQLYPLLVHLNLFGSRYAGPVEQALSRYA